MPQPIPILPSPAQIHNTNPITLTSYTDNPSNPVQIPSSSTSHTSVPTPQQIPSNLHSPTSILPIATAFTPPDQPLASKPPSIHPIIIRNRDHTRRACQFPDHVAYTTSLEAEPTSFTQENSKPEWRHAMALEMNALAHNRTWTLVPP